MGSGRADLDRRLHEEIGARRRRRRRGRPEPTRVSPDLDPDHQNRPHPIGRPSSTPRNLRRRSAPSREESQQPDLAPPAAKAATRGPRPPEIRQPPDQIAGTTPTPLPAAADREPRQGPPPGSKTLRCRSERSRPRRRSPRPRPRHGPAPASCGGEERWREREVMPAGGESTPETPARGGAGGGGGERGAKDSLS